MSVASRITKDPVAPPILRQFARTWLSIKSRKYSENYKARGIGMWPGWEGDEGFWRFATYVMLKLGERPGPGYSIDRIDNDGNYEPGNLRWSTAKRQNRNKRNNRIVVYDGVRMTIAEAAERSGIPWTTLSSRIEADVVEAEIFTKLEHGRRLPMKGEKAAHIISYKGMEMTVAEAARASGISHLVIRWRLHAKWPAECLFDPVKNQRSQFIV
jgi:hypothetical protein